MDTRKFVMCVMLALTLLCFLAPAAGAAGGPTNYPGTGAPWNHPNPGDGGWDTPPGWSGDDMVLLGIIFDI